MRAVYHSVSDNGAIDLDHAQSLIHIDGANDMVLALGRVYPAGFQVPAHCHNKTQLWCARRGVVLVSTTGRRWMIPPGHGLIIPAGIEHQTEMISEVEMQSIYVDLAVIGAEGPRVVAVTPLAWRMTSARSRPAGKG